MIDPISSAPANTASLASNNIDAEQIAKATNGGGTYESNVQATDLAPTNSVNPINEGSIYKMMSNVHGNLSSVGHDSMKVSGSDSVVDSIKAEMKPVATEKTPEENLMSTMKEIRDINLKVGEKAAFVQVVANVISGFSSSIKMLIRQS
jgi:hypothetical protein